MSQEKYIGMDVHQATISVAVMDASGKLIMECLLETKAATIVEFIQGLRGTLAVTFEEGTSAAWLHDLLKPHVSQLVVCDPRKAALLQEGNKSDRISGNKVLGRGTRRVVNRAATALRQAANTLLRSRSYLGAQFRRLRSKLGAPKAITAMAHRLARLVYRMLKYGQAYVDKGTEYYEHRFREQQIQLLTRKAAKFGLQITPIQA